MTGGHILLESVPGLAKTTGAKVLTEAIKLCRIYNKGYVTFTEIHKIITEEGYYKDKINIVKELFIKNKLNKNPINIFKHNQTYK